MFSEQDRKIFPYHDGEQEVFGDPVEIQRRMNAFTKGELNAIIDRTREWEVDSEGKPVLEDGKPVRANPAEVAAENQERLEAAIRHAFQLPAFDRITGQGCTGAMALTVWNAFVEWAEDAKKKFAS